MSDAGNVNNYAASIEALDGYFKAQLNTEFEIFEYRQMKQKDSMTVDKFATRILQKADHCNLDDKDKEFK